MLDSGNDEMMEKKLCQYQLVLIDMDGTLYYQRPLQITMGFVMLKNAIFKKGGFSELITVLKFRKMREHWSDTDEIDAKLYEMLARERNIDVVQAQEIIQKWIYDLPLNYLRRFRDDKLVLMLRTLQEKEVRTAVYSDYPSKEKQRVLEISGIPGFYGGQEEIGSLKPDPKGILYIMQKYGIEDKNEVLMIGDRMSKDGQAAISAGVDYLILKKHKWMRNRQYKNLPI